MQDDQTTRLAGHGEPNRETVEQAIQRKGLTAPRVTREKLLELVGETLFFNPRASLTICVLTMRNGFEIVGKSACASPENFDAELGRRIAFDNAIDQAWALEGYLLRQSIYEADIGVGGGK